MTSEVIYKGKLRTEAKHIRSGNTIITDAPVDNNGNGEAFSPTDLLATSLASCHLTIMGIKARDNNIDMDGAKAEVTKTMASDPRRVAKVEVNIYMPANNYSEKDKKVLMKAVEACPVSRSLSAELEIDLKIIW
jgi:uncharacterized OsmC-like protein